MNLYNLKERLSKIRLLVMDVDGTLTDGSMYYSSEGEQLKRFNVRDGMGIELLKKGNISTAIITSENSPIALARANKLKIENIEINCRDKSSALRNLASKLNMDLSEIAYIGDDVNDIHVMGICGFAACPFDSVESIKNIADYICKNSGGKGAVRELCEMILLSQNKSITLDENW